MIRAQIWKRLSGAREGKKARSKGNVRKEATTKEAMGMGRSVGIIVGKKVRRDDAIEYFLPTGIRSVF